MASALKELTVEWGDGTKRAGLQGGLAGLPHRRSLGSSGLLQAPGLSQRAVSPGGSPRVLITPVGLGIQGHEKSSHDLA